MYHAGCLDDPMEYVSGKRQVSFIALKRFYQIRKKMLKISSFYTTGLLLPLQFG